MRHYLDNDDDNFYVNEEGNISADEYDEDDLVLMNRVHMFIQELEHLEIQQSQQSDVRRNRRDRVPRRPRNRVYRNRRERAPRTTGIYTFGESQNAINIQNGRFMFNVFGMEFGLSRPTNALVFKTHDKQFRFNSTITTTRKHNNLDFKYDHRTKILEITKCDCSAKAKINTDNYTIQFSV